MDTPYGMIQGVDEFKKQQIENNSRIVLSLISAANRTLTRYKQVQDPTIRYSLFVDKFCILLDFALSILETFTEIEEYPMEVRSNLSELIKDIQKEMSLLADWIQQPNYHPDSYVGAQMMQSAHRDFEFRQDQSTRVQSPPIVQENLKKDCINPIKLDSNPFAD